MAPDRKQEIRSARVLVTGGAGFIGARLCSHLVLHNNEVCALDHPEASLHRLAGMENQLRMVRVDLGNTSAGELRNIVGTCDYIIHLASAGIDHSESDVLQMIRANIVGTQVAVELAQAISVKKFVYAGSCFEYGAGSNFDEVAFPNPQGEYAATKTAAWFLLNSYARRHGVRVTSVRPFNVYGIGEATRRLVPHVITSALGNKTIDVTEGRQARDFVYVDDIVEGMSAAAVAEQAVGDTFNLCTGIETTVKELVLRIVELTGSKSAVNFGAIPYRDNEMWNLSGNPKRAAEKIGWVSRVTIEDGLRRTVEWLSRTCRRTGE
ncbi:MAG: NAD-dependent epimerase/dehydratase family protein [Candidatus Geothermincolia bacterium]